MTEFSVLLPVYHGDTAAFFREAAESVTAQQTLRPTELVVVCDGPVGAEIERVIEELESGDLSGGVPVTVVRLPRNVGLARALEEGLKACSFEVVARADADDISVPERFAVQLPLFEKKALDLLGSAITEFDSRGDLGITRKLPKKADAIWKMAAFRDPFNHPTVVYRKSAVAAAGGYQHLNKMEDYWLFVRMLHSGARARNTRRPLVRYRVDEGAYKRRGGVEMLLSEIGLQRAMWRLGFVSAPTFVRNVLVRGGYRLVPTRIRQRAYRNRFTERA